MNEELRIKLIANVKEAKKNLAEAKKALKELEEANQEASEQSKTFSESLTEQAKELNDLKKKYMDIAAAQGTESDAAKEVAAQIEALSKEYADNKEKAMQLAQAADGLDVGLQRAEAAAKEAAAEADRLAAEQKKAAEESERLAQEQAELDDAVAATKEGFKSAATTIGASITALVASLIALTEGTREYRNEQEKLNTAFEMAGHSTDAAYETYNELNGVLGDSGQAVEAANHLAKLAKTQEDLATWTDICTGVYATFGDSLPIEGLTEAANETAKTGQLTGALTDALNWAGVAEDDFQAALDACSTEQERQALITKTLNGLYKTSADRFKKNNKEVIEANKAQEKLNKTLANLAKKVEPVITKFKTLGATLLQKLEGPLEDIGEYLTEDFIPALEEAMDWISENSEVILTLGGAIAGAVVAYKTYTLACNAAKAAQVLLNAVQMASPMGLLAAGIGLAAGALLSYGLAADDASDSSEELSTQAEKAKDGADALAQAEKELALSTDEATEAKRRQNEMYAENSAVISEMDNIKQLSDELLGMADAQGRVKENDEARVQFILNELNNALGTEYSMVDGVIQKYNELTGTIEEVINKKTANLLLEASAENYTKAIQEENDKYRAFIQTYNEYLAAKEEGTPKIEAWDKEIAALEEVLYDNKFTIIGEERKVLEERLTELEANKQAEVDKLKELEGAYTENKDSYLENQEIINNYQAASTAALEGNTQTVIDLLTNKEGAFEDYSSTVSKEEAKVLNQLKKAAIDAGLEAENTKRNFENGVSGYTKEMVDEAEREYKTALDKFATAYADAESVGEDLGDGLKDGMTSKESSLYGKAKGIVGGIIAAFREAADSHSPSRKMISLGLDMGAGAEIGLEKSSGDIEEAATAMAKDAISGFEMVNEALEWSDIGGIFDTSFLGKNTTITAKTLTSIESSTLGAAIDKLAANSKQPIIFKVGEKVFGEICVDSINAITAQTGNLPLTLG